MKVDFCYLITNGFSSRMILQSEIIPKLLEQGKSVAIIVPNSDEAAMQAIAKEVKVKVYPLAIEKNSWFTSEFFLLKKYIYEDIINNPALWEKHVRAVKFNKSKHPWRRLRPFLYMMIHYIVYKWGIGKNLVKSFEKRLISKPKVTEQIKKIDPKVFVCAYPSELMESAYLKSANELGITSVIQLLSWDNIVTKGHFSELSDHFIAWGEIMAKEAKEFYNYSEEKLHIAGVAHFDKHVNEVSNDSIKKYYGDLGAKTDVKTLIFGMSSPYFAPYEIEVVEWIAKKVNDGDFGDVQLIVRPHPQNVQGYMADTSWLPRLEKLKSNKVFVNYPMLKKSTLNWNMKSEDLIMLVNLVAGSDIVLNSCSTFSIDGLVQDKPVILTVFDSDKELSWVESVKKCAEYPHLKKLIATKGLRVTNNYSELEKAIHSYLDDPLQDISERKIAKRMECGICDGNASGRIASTLIKILKD
jgi:hypothetical protein